LSHKDLSLENVIADVLLSICSDFIPSPCPLRIYDTLDRHLLVLALPRRRSQDSKVEAQSRLDSNRNVPAEALFSAKRGIELLCTGSSQKQNSLAELKAVGEKSIHQ
jgi:hypothetical protein